MKGAITIDTFKTIVASAVYLIFLCIELVLTKTLLDKGMGPAIPIAVCGYLMVNFLWADGLQEYIYFVRRVSWNDILPLTLFITTLSVGAGVGSYVLDKQRYEVEWQVKYKTW